MKRINLTKSCVATFGLGMMLAAAPVAMAQEAPMPPNMPGAPGTANSGSNANELGSIDTSQQPVATTTTTVTTESNTGYGEYQVVGDEYDSVLPDTGGEPLLFLLAGSMLIAGGCVWRRKMTQSAS